MQGRHHGAVSKGWQGIASFEYLSSKVSANKLKLVHFSADLSISLL